MKDRYIEINKIIMKSISQLTNEQFDLLIEGKAKLVYKDLEEKKVIEKENKKLEDYKDIINTFTSIEEAKSYLIKFKKTDLIEIAKSYNLSIISKDTKDVIINKITELVIGVMLRQVMFDDYKNK